MQALPLRIRKIAGITCTHLSSLSCEAISAINKTRSEKLLAARRVLCAVVVNSGGQRIFAAHNWTYGRSPIQSGLWLSGDQNQSNERNEARSLPLQSSSCFLNVARLDSLRDEFLWRILSPYSSVRASAGKARSVYGRKTVTNHRGTLPHTYSATQLVNHWGEIRPTWPPIASHGWANAGVSHLFYHWECTCSGCCESPKHTCKRGGISKKRHHPH